MRRCKDWDHEISSWKYLSKDLLLLLLLSHFSRVRLCATPQTTALQAPTTLGFSRQEHWNGLPFPSPMQESEKWKWSHSVVSDSWWPHGLQPTRLLRPWDFPGESPGAGCHCLLRLKIYSISFPGAQSASFCTLNSLQGVSKVNSCSRTGFNLCRGRCQMPLASTNL